MFSLSHETTKHKPWTIPFTNLPFAKAPQKNSLKQSLSNPLKPEENQHIFSSKWEAPRNRTDLIPRARAPVRAFTGQRRIQARARRSGVLAAASNDRRPRSEGSHVRLSLLERPKLCPPVTREVRIRVTSFFLQSILV